MDRNHVLGSSDAASVVGLGRETRFNLWHRLVAKDVVDEPANGTALRAGKLFEAPLSALLEEERPDWRVLPAPTVALPADPRIGSSPDRIVVGRQTGVMLGYAELKLTGSRDLWGDPGSRIVPPAVLVQVRHQSALARLTGLPVPCVYVCLLVLPGWEVGIYPIEPDIEAEDALLEAERAFLDGPEPDPDPRSEIELRQRWSTHVAGKVAVLPTELLDRYVDAKRNASGYQTMADAAKLEIIAAAQDAEEIHDETGRKRFTFRTTRAFDAATAMAKHPEIVAKFLREQIDTGAFRAAHGAVYDSCMVAGRGGRQLRECLGT